MPNCIEAPDVKFDIGDRAWFVKFRLLENGRRDYRVLRQEIETIEYFIQIGKPESEDENWTVEEEELSYNGTLSSMVFASKKDAEQKAIELNIHYGMLFEAYKPCA